MNIEQVVHDANSILDEYTEEAALLCRDMLGEIDDRNYTDEAKMLACAALIMPLLKAHKSGIQYALTLHGALIGHFISKGKTGAENRSVDDRL